MISLTLSDLTSVQSMMPLYLILSEIQITGPLNIGYSDL